MSTTKPKTPQEIYLAAQAIADFKPGERVKILFKVPSVVGGWNNTWVHEMDSNVGQVVTVKRVDRCGVHFLECDCGYPYFCLERVPAEPVKVVLNDTWTAEVLSKDEVKVGCQTFKVEAVRNLVTAYASAPSGKNVWLNSQYTAEVRFTPTILIDSTVIPAENLRKLLAAVDAFVG